MTAVALPDYAYAVARVAGRSPDGRRHPWREWVLVDEDDAVLEVFGSRKPAVAELNERFDADPTTVECLRLVVMEHGRCAYEEWPRGGSPAERAGAFARHLVCTHPLGDDDVCEWVRGYFLRGELGRAHIAGEERRSVELWWYACGGEHHPVGLLVERLEEGAWQLLLDGRTRGLTQAQLHRRIAQVMRALGDDRWTEVEVARVADKLAADNSVTEALGPAALFVQAQLRLADELHVTAPLGRAWP